MKPVIPRQRARRDIDDGVAYYLEASGAPVALGFIDALETAYGHIARHPAMGALRYAHELDLPGLRIWPLSAYPHLVFYVERDDHVDVWRVLHGAGHSATHARRLNGGGAWKVPNSHVRSRRLPHLRRLL